MGKHWLPVSEFDVWIDVTWLQKTQAPATKSGSLVEDWGFSWYLLGAPGPDSAESSLGVTGVSFQKRAAKRPRKPADLLTVAEVKMLNKVSSDESGPLGDRSVSVHALHVLYSRSRWTDLIMVSGTHMEFEGHF